MRDESGRPDGEYPPPAGNSDYQAGRLRTPLWLDPAYADRQNREAGAVGRPGPAERQVGTPADDGGPAGAHRRPPDQPASDAGTPPDTPDGPLAHGSAEPAEPGAGGRAAHGSRRSRRRRSARTGVVLAVALVATLAAVAAVAVYQARNPSTGPDRAAPPASSPAGQPATPAAAAPPGSPSAPAASEGADYSVVAGSGCPPDARRFYSLFPDTDGEQPAEVFVNYGAPGGWAGAGCIGTIDVVTVRKITQLRYLASWVFSVSPDIRDCAVSVYVPRVSPRGSSTGLFQILGTTAGPDTSFVVNPDGQEGSWAPGGRWTVQRSRKITVFLRTNGAAPQPLPLVQPAAQVRLDCFRG